MIETLVTPGESHRMFRMDASLFYQLHDILVNEYGLTSSMHMNSMESLAIFLVTCGHSWSNTALQNKFKHSGETITRKFMEVLCCVVSMSNQYIRPKDPNSHNVHNRIKMIQGCGHTLKIASKSLMGLILVQIHLHKIF